MKRIYAGRIGRLEYFTGIVFLWGLTFLQFAIWAELRPSEFVGEFVALVFVLALVAIVFCHLVLSARRLHDLNYTGGVALLIFIPIANLVLGLWCLFGEGTKGANTYGDAPSTRIFFWTKFRERKSGLVPPSRRSDTLEGSR